MGSKERWLSYSIAFKIKVMNYAEKHGNLAAERRFGLTTNRDNDMKMEEAKERFNQSR